MEKKLEKIIDNLAQKYAYKRINGEVISVIPLDVISKLQKKNKQYEKEIINYIDIKGYKIVERVSFQTVRQYDHLELLDELNKFDIVVSPERQNELVKQIEKLATDYTSRVEDEYVVNIPHFKLLNLHLMPWELAFIYNYIEKCGYNIRGIDLTINREIENYTRVRRNDGLDTDRSTKPFREEKRVNKLYELAEIKKQLDLLEKMPEITYKEKIQYNSLLKKYSDLREESLNHNMRLAYQYIIDYELFGDTDEKTSQALEGYVKAFDNYIKYLIKNKDIFSKQDIIRLSTFVYQQIKWTISKYRNESELIIKPQETKKLISIINTVFYELSESIGQDNVSISDISEQMGISEKKVEEYRMWGAPVLSLDELLENDENTEHHILGYPYQEYEDEDVFTTVANIKLKEDLIKVLTTTLRENEASVLIDRYGLKDNDPKSLEYVGRNFGVTRERIREVESKTLAKLRHPSRSDRLKDYL